MSRPHKPRPTCARMGIGERNKGLFTTAHGVMRVARTGQWRGRFHHKGARRECDEFVFVVGEWLIANHRTMNVSFALLQSWDGRTGVHAKDVVCMCARAAASEIETFLRPIERGKGDRGQWARIRRLGIQATRW